MSKIRVLLVDDHPILRDGLSALLSHYDDIEVVGEAQDGLEALAHIKNLQPDIVLMDIAMQGMGGIEATQEIHRQFPGIRVLVLSQHEDWRYIKPLLQAGASGYVTKRALGIDLITALHVVAQGETFLQPSIASIVTEQLRAQTETEGVPIETLTPREQEILEYIASGKTNPQIAVMLCLSVKTVEWHRANLMNKLDVHSVADLVRYALQHELVNKEKD